MRVGLLLASLVVLASVPAADCGATKKSKRSRTAGSAAEPALRLPRSSRVDVGAYGVPARADWTKKAKLPALEARNATASPDSPDASAAMQRRIKRDGHFHIKGLLSPDEMSAFRPHIVAAALSIAARCETECETKDDPLDEKCRGCERVSTTPVSMPKSFIKARNLHRVSKVARRLVTSPRLAAVAAATLGVPTVRLYQDTAFFKEPGDRESSWHQDSSAAPVDTDKLLTIWLSLDEWGTSADTGALVFATGSHKSSSSPSLRKLPLQQRVASVSHLSDEDIAAHWSLSGADAVPAPAFSLLPAETAATVNAQGTQLAGGDASVHLGWTFHRAAPHSGGPHAPPRCALAVTFFAEGAKFYSDVLHLGVVSDSVRGIEFALEDGTHIVAQLLSDDLGTWVPWLLQREMIPGEPVRPREALLLGPAGEMEYSAPPHKPGQGSRSSPPTMASLRTKCPRELSKCEDVAGCFEVLSRALAGGGADETAQGFSAFVEVFNCVEAAKQRGES